MPSLVSRGERIFRVPVLLLVVDYTYRLDYKCIRTFADPRSHAFRSDRRKTRALTLSGRTPPYQRGAPTIVSEHLKNFVPEE